MLVFGFNSVGKTRLSVVFKNLTKDEDGRHTGIYYNAYSEDLFVWDNDIDSQESDVQLSIISSNLNKLHSGLEEVDIHAKLKPYRVNFDFTFIRYSNIDLGIKSISLFPIDMEYGHVPPIKISRGEERIFIWYFFLALMDGQTCSLIIFLLTIQSLVWMITIFLSPPPRSTT